MRSESLVELAVAYGTPLYVFDEAELKRRVEFIRDSLPSKTGVCYAMKANPFILPKLAHFVDRVEVCSSGEHAICQSISIDPQKLVISGVSKDERVIRQAIESQGVSKRYTAESVEQLDMLRRVAEGCNARLQVLLRVTSGNQFGMDVRTIKDIALTCSSDPCLDICGIQFYSGTQKRSLQRIERELGFLGGLLKELQHECGLYVRELEYGPGFPVDYFDDGSRAQREACEREFLRGVADLLAKMRPKRKVILELGRALVASCGAYVTSVVDVKSNNGENYAILDGGMHHLAYYGNSMALKQPPCRLLEAPDSHISNRGGKALSWNLCGSLCTSSDILAKRICLKGLGKGSLLTFDRAGAYCMTEGISLFLSRDLPAVVVVDKLGHSRVVRDRLPTSSANTPRVDAKWAF